jgi:hypothetical protein
VDKEDKAATLPYAVALRSTLTSSADGVKSMSAQGLLLDIMIMLGGAVAVGLPMAAAIIWLFS